jgi:hypothetical protein
VDIQDAAHTFLFVIGTLCSQTEAETTESDNTSDEPPSLVLASRPTVIPKFGRKCGLCGIAGHLNSPDNPCEGKAKKGARTKQKAMITTFLLVMGTLREHALLVAPSQEMDSHHLAASYFDGPSALVRNADP